MQTFAQWPNFLAFLNESYLKTVETRFYYFSILSTLPEEAFNNEIVIEKEKRESFI